MDIDKHDDPSMRALRRAVDACGGVGALARALGLSRSAVSNWLLRGRLPVEQALRIARLPGCGVTAHELRPDMIGPPDGGIERRSGVPDRRRRGERRQREPGA